jgi:trehalose-6-phosphatase
MLQRLLASIKPEARRIMERYRVRIAGSVIRENQLSLTWNYRHSDPEWAHAQSDLLCSELKKAFAEFNIRVVSLKDEVVVCTQHSDKGTVVRDVLEVIGDAGTRPPFICCACFQCFIHR